MHPDPQFRADADAMAMVAAVGMAHVFVATPEGQMVVHAPLTVHGDAVRFHVARRNRAALHLDGATVLASVMGANGYVSPNWYGQPGDQVPTWNYAAVEMTGTVRALAQDELTAQLDILAATFEPLANPAAPWTRGKMGAGGFAAMLRGIRGFELTIADLRGTAKLSQNKPVADRHRVADGFAAAGNPTLAALVRNAASATGGA